MESNFEGKLLYRQLNQHVLHKSPSMSQDIEWTTTSPHTCSITLQLVHNTSCMSKKSTVFYRIGRVYIFGFGQAWFSTKCMGAILTTTSSPATREGKNPSFLFSPPSHPLPPPSKEKLSSFFIFYSQKQMMLYLSTLSFICSNFCMV